MDQAGPVSPSGSHALGETRRPDGPWLFGKLPAHGDFIGRGLDPAVRDALDGWLSAELAQARARFADQFDARYQSASPWHFVDRDPAGGWSGGALCLSVDAVGRRFPILLGVPVADPAAASAVAAAALELVFSALGEGWEASRLHAELGRLAPQATGAPPAQSGWAIEAEDGTCVEIPGRFPRGLIERMLEIA